MEDRCICCGAVIPEGRHICRICENKSSQHKSAMGYGQQKPFRIVRLVIRHWALGRLLKNTKKKSKETKEEANG